MKCKEINPRLTAYLHNEVSPAEKDSIQAHLDGNPDPITGVMADSFLSVSGGDVRTLTTADIAERYERYLGSTRYTVYRSLRHPVIGFSEDGSLAWLIARVRAGFRRGVVYRSAGMARYDEEF